MTEHERFVDNLHVPLTAEDFIRLDEMSNGTGIPAKTIARVAIRQTLAAYAITELAAAEKGKRL